VILFLLSVKACQQRTNFSFAAEYVMSLTNLSLNTFCGAITEKYRDLYWDESLLLNLYEVVNEEKSSHERLLAPFRLQ